MLNKLLFALLAIGSYFTGSVQAEIIETKEIARVLDFAAPDALLFFNISDTLYEPGSSLADNQWRLYFADRVNDILSESAATQKYINEVKNSIVNNIPKKAVEPITAKLIRDLQDKKIPVLGITQKLLSTAYASNFGEITSKHLESVGIYLQRTLEYLNYKNAPSPDYKFAYGILFAEKKPEGPAILSFLKHLSKQPARIVMVDNSREALENVQKALAQTGIKFFGIRYGRADERKEQFDPTIGTIEYLHFRENKTLLSDEEAKKIKAAHPEINYQELLDSLIKKDNP